jgi:hypothetical protein
MVLKQGHNLQPSLYYYSHHNLFISFKLLLFNIVGHDRQWYGHRVVLEATIELKIFM